MAKMGILTYECGKCGRETISIKEIFRDDFVPPSIYKCMHCEGEAKLISYIPPRSRKIIRTNGETYFETALGHEINTRDIDKIAKEKGWVYGGDDLAAEAAKNKKYTEEKCYNKFRDGLREQLRGVL